MFTQQTSGEEVWDNLFVLETHWWNYWELYQEDTGRGILGAAPEYTSKVGIWNNWVQMR